jgi:hypothetical protein
MVNMVDQDTEFDAVVSDEVQRWQKRLDREEKAHEEFRKHARQAEKAARDDGDLKQAFNIHWSNTQITRNAVYASVPIPDVRRRYTKPDPEEKDLARLVERALSYSVDVTDFDTQSDQVVKDLVEVGLGVVRVVYDVATEPMPDEVDPEMGEIAAMMGVQIPESFDDGNEQIVSQGLMIEHVPHCRFRWEPGKPWKHVNWISIDSMQPKHELEEQYGIKLKSGGQEDKAKDKRKSEKYNTEVLVHEIFDKTTREVIIFAEGHPEVLEKYEDTLNLVDFFPVPRPLFTNLKSDELIPKPDFKLVEKQIVELNAVTQRIDKITRQIRDVSFYDPKLSAGLEATRNAKDGDMVPVNNLAAALASSTGKADFDNVIAHLPMQEKIMVVRELEGQREAIKNQVYEILGISDIIRGSSKASETAAAQNIKGQWAGVRLSAKTKDVARLWRDVFRMKAEIICEHFEPEQIELMTGVEITPRMREIMVNDIGRTFAIDIETDSTVAQDDLENRQATMEMIETMVGTMERLIPGVQSGAIPLDLAQEVLILVCNSHKHGKQIEDAVMGLTEHMSQGVGAQMQQLQQQIQQMGQQLEQGQMQAEEMGKALQKFNAADEARKDAQLQLEVANTQADNARADAEVEAKAELNEAQTLKTLVEAGQTIDQTMLGEATEEAEDHF